MKLFSWNVNGFRAVRQKEDWNWFAECDADVFGIQETKAMPEQINEEDRNPVPYTGYWLGSRVKKGYSGVAAFSRTQPLAISEELPHKQFQGEGRLLHLEYERFHFMTVYFPNGQKNEERLNYKMGFYDAFLDYAEDLRRTKPIVVCGDFNTAHNPIDIARPKENEGVSGFLPMERAWMDKFEQAGYVDTFRFMHPEQAGAYSWWSYRMRARERNVGWRLDYFYVSEELRGAIKNAWIENTVFGSDHCPVGLELAL